jgi:chaperonin GroES
MKNIQPTNNYVLIKLDEKTEEKTAGGLYIPDSAKEKPSEGEVAGIAVGASEEIAVGDRVIFKEFSGTEIKFDNKKYLLIPVADILAKYVEVDAI